MIFNWMKNLADFFLLTFKSESDLYQTLEMRKPQNREDQEQLKSMY